MTHSADGAFELAMPPESYALTADSCVEAVKLVLAGVDPGALTPSMAFGRDFVTALAGVTVHDIVTH